MVRESFSPYLRTGEREGVKTCISHAAQQPVVNLLIFTKLASGRAFSSLLLLLLLLFSSDNGGLVCIISTSQNEKQMRKRNDAMKLGGNLNLNNWNGNTQTRTEIKDGMLPPPTPPPTPPPPSFKTNYISWFFITSQ